MPDQTLFPSPSISIEKEMQESYLAYAMSVIVSRALPDVRDGLKPVHRRILYAMYEKGYVHAKAHKKCARIVGDVLGLYHPHGDTAIYDALVRMAQNFSTRVPLIDGQGNFGTMDGDSAAAMRYTEARLTAISDALLRDLDKNTVDFVPNYDETETMPSILPAGYPNLLVNGSMGIAVGMATNIPPHNLGEVIDGCCHLIDNPEDTDLSSIVFGPDFPTGGKIMGTEGIRKALDTGRGTLIVRGVCQVRTLDRYTVITITQLPYQVNKSKLVAKIAELLQNKDIEGITDLRDESDRNGIKIVIEVRKDIIPEVLLNQLYALTPLQTTFSVNALALHQGQPLCMNMVQMLNAFIAFRFSVLTRRTIFELNKAQARAHIITGLYVAVSCIDPMVQAIRQSKDREEARHVLQTTPWPAECLNALFQRMSLTDTASQTSLCTIKKAECYLSLDQTNAILDLRLHRLTGLEHQNLVQELEKLLQEIQRCTDLLSSDHAMRTFMKQELQEIKTTYATPRRTSIEDYTPNISLEDLIPKEDMVVTVSVRGYIKRVPLGTYKSQHRGGKGRNAMDTVDEDAVQKVIVANTHTVLLFFSDKGQAYTLKVYELPLATPQSKGKNIRQLLPFEKTEALSTLIPLGDTTPQDQDLIFVTSYGHVRRNSLKDFSSIRSNGLMAMRLEENSDERLVNVCLCHEDQDVILTTREGRSIRFSVKDVRRFAGRSSRGVRGIRLKNNDCVVSTNLLSAQKKDELLLTISERGFGKRTLAQEYRVSGRGGQGVATMQVTKRTGYVVNTFPVHENDHILLLTNAGQMIRCPVNQIRVSGRRTQGVIIFRVQDKETLVSAINVPQPDIEVLDEIDTE